MRQPITQLRCWAVLFSLAVSLQITAGYYNPAAQRWINRDPIGEAGAELMHAPPRRVDASRVPAEQQAAFVTPYTFLANAPSGKLDALGLASMPIRIAGPTQTLNSPGLVCALVSQTEPIQTTKPAGGSSKPGETLCIWRCRWISPETGPSCPYTEITRTTPPKPCPRPKDCRAACVRPYQPGDWGDNAYE